MTISSLRLFTLIGVLCLLPCSASAKAPTEKDAPPTKGLLAQADAIAEQVATLRALPLKAPLKRDVRTREQLRTFLVKAISEEYTPAQIEAESLTFKHLGLLPDDLNYGELILNLLTEQIAGFYDPKVKQLYIMTGLASAIQAPTMAHEIFHALQDQHYDLLKLQGPFDPTTHSDFTMARSALFEGDATVLMLDFTLYEQKVLPKPATDSSPAVTTMAMMPVFTETMKSFTVGNLLAMEKMLGGGDSSPSDTSDAAVNKAPPLIKESLLFPYLAGLRFTLIAYETLGSWKAFQDTLYASAPVSTEQILHPERYFAGDMPTLLEFDPGSAMPDASRIYDNVLGEFQMHLALRQHIRVARPAGAPLIDVDVDSAMEGWGGDRLLTYKANDGRITTIHLSTWDTAKDALDYHSALHDALATRYYGRIANVQSAEAGLGKASYFMLDAPSGLTYIERWGDTVLHIEGLKAPDSADELSANYAPLKRVRDATYGSMVRLDFNTEMQRLLNEQAAQKADTP